MSGVTVNPNANYITVNGASSSDVFVLAKTQTIIVDPATQAVSVVNAGPHGPAGGGAGAAYHKHSQNVPSTIWTINHNLGLRTNVSVYDSTDDEVEADIRWSDNDNTTIIIFAYGITGIAIFS